MAKSSKGRNAGVTGLVDFQGTPQFVMRVARFSRQEGAAARVRTKRGDARRRITQTTPGGTLMLWGTVRKDGFPEPASLKGASGTVVLTLGGAAKQTLEVTVLSSKIDHDDESEDEWEMALVAEVTANPAAAGFGGTQPPAAADPELDAAQTHEGATKTVDPDGLQDLDTVRIDVDGLTDTDAAEATWITDTIAGFTATRLHMKVRSAAFARADHWGGTLTVTLGRTTTAEDLINQNTWTVSDTNNIADAASVAAINDNASGPPGMIYRTTKTQELNDDNNLLVDEYGLRSTAQDITMPESGHTIDPLAIESTQKETLTYAVPGAAPGPPAAASAELQVVATSTQAVNAVTSKVTYAYDVNDSHQKEEFPRTRRQTDASAIDREHLVADVFTTASPPSDPTPPAGLVQVDYVDVPLTPTQSVRVYRYAYVNAQTAIEVGKYELATDPNALRSTEILAAVWDSSLDEPETPSAPPGLTLVDYRDLGIPTHPTKQVRVFRYGTADSKQEIEYPGTWLMTDTSGLADEERRTVVTNAATLSFPTNSGSLFLRDYTPKRLTNGGLYEHVATYGRQTRAQEIERKGTVSQVFPDRVADHAVATILSNTNSASAIAASIYLANTNVASFGGAEVTRLDGTYALQTVHTRDTSWELEVHTRTYGAVPTSCQLLSSGTVQCYVVDVFQFDDTHWVFVLGEVPVRATMMRFTIWKVYAGGLFYAYMDGAGTTNDADFMGLTKRCVTYAGVDGRARFKDDYRYPAATNPATLAFESGRRAGFNFDYDSRGIVLADGLVVGREYYTDNDLSALTPGSWVNASTLGLSVTHGIDANYHQTFLATTP